MRLKIKLKTSLSVVDWGKAREEGQRVGRFSLLPEAPHSRPTYVVFEATQHKPLDFVNS